MSQIRKYVKYAQYGPLLNFEEKYRNLKYVNTSNTLNTDHFQILKNNFRNIKYVNTSNTLNTGHFKNPKKKNQIRKYAKYGPL